MKKIYLGIPEDLRNHHRSSDSVVMRAIRNLIDLNIGLTEVNDPADADILHLWRPGQNTRDKTEFLCKEFRGRKKIIIEARGNSITTGWEWLNQDRILRGDVPKIYDKDEVDAKENFLIDSSDIFRVPSLLSKNSFMTGDDRDRKVCVRPPGYNSGVYRYEKDVTLDIFKGRFVIAFFGRFRYRRGFHNFIDIIKGLKKNDDMTFVACGLDRGALEYAEKWFRDQHELLVFEPDNAYEMARVMMSSHIVLAPSIESGFGLSTAEAMACGCYPLISANAGISYLALQNAIGNIINPYNLDIWIKNLYSLYDTYTRKPEIFDRNRERIAQVIQRYNYKNFMNELKHDYGRV